MKTTEYLYGCDIKELPGMKEGLEARILKASELLNKLLKTPLENRDWERVNAVVKAISHNTNLLNGAI
jgi:hypothetical protein